MEFFLLINRTTLKTGPEFYLFIAMALAIKELNNNLFHIKILNFISEDIMSLFPS